MSRIYRAAARSVLDTVRHPQTLNPGLGGYPTLPRGERGGRGAAPPVKVLVKHFQKLAGFGAAPQGLVVYNGHVDKIIYKRAVDRHPGALAEPYDAIYASHGFEALYTISRVLGGTTVYVPLSRHLFMGCVHEEIRREYNRYNVRELARKYGYTIHSIHRIVRGPS